MNATSRVDVIVVGAGLVGQATALALAARSDAAGLSIALVDARHPTDRASARFDPRASAVTEASRIMLDALGVWAKLREIAQPIREIRVTDPRPGAANRPVLLGFGAVSGVATVSAHMVENHHLHDALWRTVAESAGIEMVSGSPVDGVEVTGPGAAVRLGDGRRFEASLVVAADGRGSFVRQSAGIDTVGWSYPQHGIVTTVTHERDHRGVAEEHFLPAGPFAILPLKGNRSSLVWTEDSAIAEAIVADTDEAFGAELSRRFGDHLGAVAPVGPRTCFPLSMSLARSYVVERVALVGDAAHSIHPVAGLGFNLGLRDAAELSDRVTDSFRLGLDIGSLGVLGAYERARRFDNVLVALATDGLNRLFSNDNSAVRAIRDLGLSVVDRVNPLKRAFMARASAGAAGLPSLMRRPSVRH